MLEKDVNKLFGTKSNPYLIWAPRWIESSAGIRAIHYLCHALNSAGHNAWLVISEPPHGNKPRINASLITPELTVDSTEAINSGALSPIAIYPEDVVGNPLNAPIVIRILWNFAGALGGPSTFPESEIVWAFSENIALDYESRTGMKPDVLFVPPIDPREFSRAEEKKPYQIVYAGKYRSFVGKPFSVGHLPTIEIFRDGPGRQSRETVKKLLSEAEVVYSFENSSIVTEAILSGTPAGFVPNEFLGPIIAEHELGWSGSFIGTDKLGIENARESVDAGIQAYYESIKNFGSALSRFILISQEAANGVEFLGEVKRPKVRSAITKNRLYLSIQMIRSKGFKVFFKELGRFIRSRT
jgi:hypothetical protein